MKTLLLAVLLFSSSAFADPWRTEDTYREVAFQVLNIIDWGQTRYIAEHPTQFYERDYSGLIGSNHPSVERVDAVMAGVAIAHFAISKTLVHYDLRTAANIFQYVTIGMKLSSTVRNASIGIKVSF